ncbi:MAG: hypothetical protein GC168_02530 [Candidatus Hydrogenedens sp.]|nr:hypothetical protein [Candidatus Hydrogenedens sp.]
MQCGLLMVSGAIGSAYAGSPDYCGLVIGNPVEYVIQPGDSVFVPVYYVPGDADCDHSVPNPFEGTDLSAAAFTCETAAADGTTLSIASAQGGEGGSFIALASETDTEPAAGLVGYLEVSAAEDAPAFELTPCSQAENPLNYACPGVRFRISTSSSTTATFASCTPSDCGAEGERPDGEANLLDYYSFLTGTTRSETRQESGVVSTRTSTAIVVLAAFEIDGTPIIEELRNSITRSGANTSADIVSVYYAFEGGRIFSAPTVIEVLERARSLDLNSVFADQPMPLGGADDVAAIRRYACATAYAGLYGDIRTLGDDFVSSIWDESPSLIVVKDGSLEARFHIGEEYDYYATDFDNVTLSRNTYVPIGGEESGIAPLPIPYPWTCDAHCSLKADPVSPTSALVLPQASQDDIKIVIDLGSDAPAPLAFVSVLRFVQESAPYPRLERRIPFPYDVITGQGTDFGAAENEDHYVGIAQRELFGEGEGDWSLLRAGHGSYPGMETDLPGRLELPLAYDGFRIEYADTEVPADGRAWTEDEFGNQTPLEHLPAVLIFDHSLGLGLDTILEFNAMDMNDDGIQSPRELLFHYPYLQPDYWPVPNRFHNQHANLAESFRALTNSPFHDADENQDNVIDLSDLLGVIQLFTANRYGCASAEGETEVRFVPGIAPEALCVPHIADNHGIPDYHIDLTELLRVVQFYNVGAYADCINFGGRTTTEDGFCPE